METIYHVQFDDEADEIVVTNEQGQEYRHTNRQASAVDTLANIIDSMVESVVGISGYDRTEILTELARRLQDES